MKKLLLTLFTFTFYLFTVHAQAPQSFKYQTIARNNSGNIIPNQKVSFRMSILQGSIVGPVSYEETDTATTNQFGLANLSIGMGTIITGTVAGINWANGPYFIKIEFDPTGGNSFTVMGTSQMLSVPYALYAETSGNGPLGATGPTGVAGPTGLAGATGPTGAAGNGYPIKDSAWTTVGNAGTNPAVNFMGTTDNEDVVFRQDNTQAGWLNQSSGNTAWGVNSLSPNSFTLQSTAVGVNALEYATFGSNDNTAVGFSALFVNTTGSYNTAMGNFSMSKTTTGTQNTAYGHATLQFNTTGGNNTAVGDAALYWNTASGNTGVGESALTENTTGSPNTACGAGSLGSNTTGANNVAMGDNALVNNTTASFNTAIGSTALQANTTGFSNTASGYSAMVANTTGFNNTANGAGALLANTTGNTNTAIGFQSLYSNTVSNQNTALGYQALYKQSYNVGVATDNVAIGYWALYADQPTANNNGYQNVAVGDYALGANTTGFFNAALGMNALEVNTTGNTNTAFGAYALDNNTTGSNNTATGYGAGPSFAALNNTTALGYLAATLSSNSVVVGNASVTSIGGFVNWSNLSDSRFKNNVQQNVPGLDFIMKLKPVTYNLDVKRINSFLGVADKDEAAIAQKSSVIYSGFLAQEVEQAAKDANYDFSGVIKPQNDKDHYKMSYADFVVPLVKAVQEQQQMIDELKKEVDELKKQNELLKNQN